jgi:tetratricopeptide (TPR) repeat protein
VDIAQALRSLLAAGRFQDALEQYRELADGPEGRRPDIQLLAATAATRLGDLVTGKLLAEEALEKFRTRGDRDGSMRSYNLLGAIHWEHGQVGLAEVCFGEALRLARQLQDSLMLARASNNLASVAHLQGRFDQAAELFRGALLAYHRLGDRRGTAETYHNLGFAYRQNGEWRQAEDAAAAAVRHAEMVGEPALLALALAARAELKIERDDPDLAERELERAERYATTAADEIGSAEVHRVQALNALHRRNWPLALTIAGAARTVALRYDSALLAAECAGIAARALKALGRQEEAEQRRSDAAAAFRQLGATTLLERLERELEA